MKEALSCRWLSSPLCCWSCGRPAVHRRERVTFLCMAEANVSSFVLWASQVFFSLCISAGQFTLRETRSEIFLPPGEMAKFASNLIQP
jgi:hypothetical protein